MINVQNARIIDYGSAQKVTVYFDDVDPKQYYIVPSPRVVIGSGGVPHFSIAKYLKNDAKVSGLCAFDVELGVSPEAQQAVVNALPPDFYQGQLTWLAADAYFYYEVEGEVRVAAGSGSMYGANRVSYSIELKSDAEIKSFVNAFRGTHGALSPFSVEYEAVVLTRMPEVSVTVTYDPDIAITYETQYVTEKDIWGQGKQVASGVKQNLKDSGAGKVDVVWSVTPSDETRQRVYDWGFTTLEKLVSDALSNALLQSGGKSPVSYVGEIQRTFSEKEVVEWSFVTSDPLIAYDDEIWQKYVYKEIQTQQLAVQFSLLGELTKVEDGGAIIKEVLVTVDYPTKTTGNTFKLTPQANSLLYTAPGQFYGPVFDNKYSYRYEVYFVSDENPYVSEKIESTDTRIEILPNQLGIRQTTFIGSNIPFKAAELEAAQNVDKLVIDFFFLRPGGQPNKVESKVMTANGNDNKVEFSSLFKLPITNTYTYRLTYQMSDGSTFVMEPTDQFGSANKDLVMVLNPFRERTFLLRAQVKKGTPPPQDDTPSIDNVFLDARYIDKLNKADLSQNFEWNPPAVSTSGLASGPPWTYNAIYNPDGAYYEFNGLITYSDGDASVSNLCIQATQGQLKLSPSDEPYSIQVDGSIVNWEAVDKVEVTLFQSAGEVAEAAAELLFTPGSSPNPAELKVTNLMRYPLLKPITDQPAEDFRFYLIQRPRTDDSISFYYNATYIYANGTVKYIADTEITNKFVLILPAEGTETKPALRQQVLKFPAKPRAA